MTESHSITVGGFVFLGAFLFALFTDRFAVAAIIAITLHYLAALQITAYRIAHPHEGDGDIVPKPFPAPPPKPSLAQEPDGDDELEDQGYTAQDFIDAM